MRVGPAAPALPPPTSWWTVFTGGGSAVGSSTVAETYPATGTTGGDAATSAAAGIDSQPLKLSGGVRTSGAGKHRKKEGSGDTGISAALAAVPITTLDAHVCALTLRAAVLFHLGDVQAALVFVRHLAQVSN